MHFLPDCSVNGSVGDADQHDVQICANSFGQRECARSATSANANDSEVAVRQNLKSGLGAFQVRGQTRQGRDLPPSYSKA
jgi:hypothetical protein